MNLNKSFINHCKKNNLDINPNQLDLIEKLNQFYNLNFNKSSTLQLSVLEIFKANTVDGT